jgi:hypothetical protein
MARSLDPLFLLKKKRGKRFIIFINREGSLESYKPELIERSKTTKVYSRDITLLKVLAPARLHKVIPSLI